MVRTFELEAPDKLKRPVLRVAYDDNATIYINGVKTLELKRGNNAGYKLYPLLPEVAAAQKSGANTIAIHAENKKKKKQSQFIDAGIGEESITW